MRTPSPPRSRSEIVEPQPMFEALGEQFDESQCGTIECRVEWQGDIPLIPSLHLPKPKVKPSDGRMTPNPNAPQVSRNHELSDAVIVVRGIDLRRSRPWNPDPMTVEIADDELRVRPSAGTGRFGIVRRGAAVELVSRQPGDHSIRGRGASFFNQMVFTKDQAVSRQLSDDGVVELDSGTWYYWHRAYLVVSDHPYVGVSGKDGRVQLNQVPAGEYEIVCSKANWHIAEIQRDREWLTQNGVVFAPPVEKRTTVRVTPGGTSKVVFRLQSTDFAPRVNSNK
jgi:hypothetical protein